MRKNKISKCLTILSVLFFLGNSFVVRAQETDALGTYTPYSLYGIGDISKHGTALNRGMGGIGTGLRDNRFINYMNPASITERDTLSFMLDFGVDMKNFYNTDGKSKSAYNTFNVQNFVFTAPVYKKSAMIVGISPYSNIGYKFESTETDPYLVSKYGDIKYQKYGTGSINQLFIGAAMNVTKNISVGAEYIYYFGALDRYSNVIFNTDASLRSLNTGWDYALGASSGRVGAQYFATISQEKGIDLTVGAAYRFAAALKGDYSRFAYAKGAVTDTVVNDVRDNYKMRIPGELSVGFTIRKKDKWLFGADYVMQDWSKEKMESASADFDCSYASASSYRVGFEFIPNKYDIRYYLKRVAYRVGAYYDKSYLKFGNRQINAAGFTLGMSLPIYRMYNAINISVDLGQRGSTKHNLVRERYVQLNLNICLHDIWFVKHRYQ